MSQSKRFDFKAYNREIFERTYGISVSSYRWDKFWIELRKLEKLPEIKSITKGLIQGFAEWKIRFPNVPLSSEIYLKLIDFHKEYQGKESFKGSEILTIVQKYRPDLKVKTFYHCFYKAQLNYNANDVYSYEELSTVVLNALAIRERSKTVSKPKASQILNSLV